MHERSRPSPAALARWAARSGLGRSGGAPVAVSDGVRLAGVAMGAAGIARAAAACGCFRIAA
eukprot:14018526-Alexandrium_andersonii.AAC.1